MPKQSKSLAPKGFGLPQSVPLQGGIAKVNTQPSKLSGKPPAKPSITTPMLTDDALKANVRPKPQGGTGFTASSPKPFSTKGGTASI